MPPEQNSSHHQGDSDPGYEVVEGYHTEPTRPRRGRTVHSTWWVRLILVLMAVGFTGVFVIALWLNPYQSDGSPRQMATHTQLGMPPCNMVALIGKPCPTCGMTTSFSLLVHGDVLGSLRANWCGTLLALYWLMLIPWAVIAAVRGKLPFVKSGERLALISVTVFLMLSLARWIGVLIS